MFKTSFSRNLVTSHSDEKSTNKPICQFVRKKSTFTLLSTSLLTLGLTACLPNEKQDTKVVINKNPYPSTYQALTAESTLLTNATILTGTGERLNNADILLVNGKVTQVGNNLSAEQASVIDMKGKWITPGIIDVHSHLGVYPNPAVESHSDGNETVSYTHLTLPTSDLV